MKFDMSIFGKKKKTVQKISASLKSDKNKGEVQLQHCAFVITLS